MASACHISSLNQRALAGAIGHAICTCVLLSVHTDQTSLVSGFSNRRQNEGALSLLESHLVRLFNPFPRLIPIENKHGNHTMPLWPGCQPTGWNMWREEDNGQNYNMRHTVKGEGGDKYESQSPACLWGQLLWDVCLCSPGPGALTPVWADLDKKQLSLPHSSPHPRGRCTALYTTALDSIKPEQSHLLLHLQPL